MTAPSGKPTSQATGNTLRLAGNELAKLVEELDRAGSAGPAFKRSHHRWPFRHGSIRMDVLHPNGQTTSLHYACRNLSSGGVSLLHSSYIHTGTRVTVFVPKAGGVGEVASLGRVTRCRHFRGNVHEIGVKFDSALEVREILSLDPLEGRFTLEHVEPDKLRGTLLHVEDSVIDRRLVRHFLRETSLNVVAVETSAEALKRVAEGFDAVLCDFILPGATGADLCLELRQKDVRVPVILTSADTSRDVRAAVKSCHADAYLQKPFTRELLLRALAEFLLVTRVQTDRSGAMFSTLSSEDPMAGMLEEFIEEVHALAKQLRAVSGPQAGEQAVLLCMKLRSGAPPMGFERLAQAAERALGAVRAGGGDVQASLNQLASVCERVALQRGRSGGREETKAA